MEVEMKIRGLLMDPVTNMPIVILKDAGTDTVLPIWVGIYEANAIALEIEKVSTPRPMTHDLIKNVLVGLDTHGPQSGGDGAAGRHVLCGDLAGARGADCQHRFAAVGCAGAGVAGRLSRFSSRTRC